MHLYADGRDRVRQARPPTTLHGLNIAARMAYLAGSQQHRENGMNATTALTASVIKLPGGRELSFCEFGVNLCLFVTENQPPSVEESFALPDRVGRGST